MILVIEAQFGYSLPDFHLHIIDGVYLQGNSELFDNVVGQFISSLTVVDQCLEKGEFVWLFFDSQFH